MATLKDSEARESLGSMQSPVHSETSEYCAKLQEWMWQYYCGYLNWQSWMAAFAAPLPPCCSPQTEAQGQPALDGRSWYYAQFLATVPSDRAASPAPGSPASPDRPVQQQNGNVPQAGHEFTIPTPLHRFCAEVLDFIILFCMKAAVILTVMHLSGMKDVSKLALHFIVEEISEDTSMEELQKMMVVALVYRVLVCFYEIICIWGAGGATPGKFLLDLRVVTCDSAILVRPSRVRVIPASNVSLSASTVRALNKNFSIAFFFPAFITLLLFQHNRTVYDIVAGTIVVKRSGAR
ncbi:protein FAM8A1-like [Brienomyrus brachyistius]|uniref:protein FAM8A1-like n=1 Tax=Brienomyrus brachyistius TaxID=42636 RepID=UPI0020B403DF|nr:protein FAM8A1-like [Brienomyrus brachyistius]